MKRFFARWVYGRTGGMRYRMLSWPLALLAVLALHAASVHVLTNLTFNNAPEAYYPPDSPAVVLRDELRRDFPTDEALTVLFHGNALYSADFLRRLDALAARLRQHPLVDRVTTLTSFERISGSRDGFTVEPLVDVGQIPGDPEVLKRHVLSDRFVPGLLASRDGQYVAMAVRPVPLRESSERLQLKLAVAKAINETGLGPYYAGDAGQVTMDVAQLASILRDTAWLVPLTVIIGLALLWWVVGRLMPVVIGAVAMSTVVAPTIAGIVAFGQPYTMATAILPSLLAAYTVATLLHLYAGVQRAQRTATTRSQVIDRALAETRRPSAYNVLTTGAGLLSLLLVPIPPVQVFGVAGAAGTLLVFVTVFFLVPPVLRRWDQRRWPQHTSGMGRLGRLARRVALLSMRWPKTVIAALVGAVIVAFPHVQQVEIETDLLAFFAADHPINVDTRRIESALAGVTTLEISLRGAGRDAFQRLETLREVKRFQQWLEDLPEVDRTVSMVDLVEEMHWAMNRERPQFRTLPPTDRLLRQYLLVYDGNDLYELVNRDFDHARIVLNLNVHGTREIGRTIETIRAQVAAAPIADVKVDVGGYGRLLADQVGLLVEGQLNSFAGAFAQIFVLMALLLRSAKGAALCMAPNLAPLYFIFVLMGATGIPLDLATVMIASVVLGITVDDTIHLYHGVARRLSAGMSPLFAIARSYESAGRAVLAVSTVLIAQFALFTTSDFIPTANFGLMTAAGLLTGLLFEVLLLPALLVLAARLPWTWRSALGLRRKPTPRTPVPKAVQTEPSAFVATTPGELTDIAATTRRRVLVCHGDACKQAGAPDVWRLLREEKARLARLGIDDALQATKTSCLSPCRHAPVVQIYPEDVCYGPLDEAGTAQIIERHLRRGQTVANLVVPASTPTKEHAPKSERPDITL
ncbi:MMPL family transporter [Calidifontimicrobium sp. SYSU G02091]|uniref:MMPL family transporter n=1 Tax=Calidifontimicrobium sp. SYSU G02091 TaxID=2926421 RepID=UPI001F5350D3|nr:MMPL family transporter [Calidifontimicrobium sp. SYSU G02091]